MLLGDGHHSACISPSFSPSFNPALSHISSMSTFPIVSQLKSLWHLVTGDVEGAKRVQEEFIDAWKNHPMQEIGSMVDSVPIAGHVKGRVVVACIINSRFTDCANIGIVHLAKGDSEGFWRSEEAATRTLVVLTAGALTVGTGGAGAPILAGVVAGLGYDAVVTGELTFYFCSLWYFGLRKLS